ncbi:PEP-CTERM sorting domain-containing protein [Coraliomargarita sp. W4R72]
MKNRLLLSLFIVAATSAQADTILFKDTYNVTGDSSTNLNFERSSRQAAGSITGDYTYTAVSDGNDVFNNEFRTRANATKIDANFAAGMGAYDFTLSIDGRNASDISWIAFSMISTNQSGRGSTDISLRLNSNDVISLGGGTNAPSGTVTSIGKDAIQALDDSLSTWNVNDSYTYAFVATATDAYSGTYDFTINGIVAASGISYAFTDTTLRTFDWSNVGTDAVGGWDNTTLTVVPEPNTYALIGGLFALGAVALRSRK